MKDLQAERAVVALAKLTDWAREYTSPRDENSPDGILIEACAVLESAGVRQINGRYFQETKPDPRDPDYSRKGVFVYHNCSRCSDGARPCVNGNPRNCDWLHARND